MCCLFVYAAQHTGNTLFLNRKHAMQQQRDNSNYDLVMDNFKVFCIYTVILSIIIIIAGIQYCSAYSVNICMHFYHVQSTNI